MNYFILILKKIVVSCMEFILPKRYYIQEIPYRSIYQNHLPNFHSSAHALNYRPDKVSRDGVRWFMIRLIMDQVEACEAGDYAELGTFRGKTARVIYEALPDDAQLYCFDTFSGFAEDDVNQESSFSKVPVNIGDFGDTSKDSVRSYILNNRSEKAKKLILVEGRFPDTFDGLHDHSWRFVHLDCDLAEPTRSGLELFWPRLVPGGVILIHDFNGYFSEGLQKVVWDFCKLNGVTPVPMCDNGGSVALAKPLSIERRGEIQ